MKEKLKAWAAEADFHVRRQFSKVQTVEQAKLMDFYHDMFQRRFAEHIVAECAKIAYNHSPEAGKAIVEEFNGKTEK